MTAAIILALAVTRPYGQQLVPSAFIAFRVDPERVVATVLLPCGIDGPQVREGLSPSPVARFGYEFFEPPDYWGALPTEHKVGDRWLIQTVPGQAFEATVERRVGGYFGGCTETIGVLLHVIPAQARGFGAVRHRYFVATPAPTETPKAAGHSDIRALPTSTITSEVRRSIESILDTMLARELPVVRSKDAPGLSVQTLQGRFRSDRAHARQRLQILDALERSQGKLAYNVQAFQLAPDRVPVLFVRAEWLVGSHQGFAGSI